MHVIIGRNVNDCYRQGVRLVAQSGVVYPSRVGHVVKMHAPVTTVYERPLERVLFDEQRDANPFFHLFEALWMLNGQNDVESLAYFLPRFRDFSDDGLTLHGAYGYRWRHWPEWVGEGRRNSTRPGIDQLAAIIRMLRKNPDDRRAVISMWDPVRDLESTSKDVPCNDLIKVAIINDRLDLQIFCRSNDAVLGCYGANAVHFSVLHEYLAAMIGVPVGRYYQISADFHAYTTIPYTLAKYFPFEVTDIQYQNPYVQTTMITDGSIVEDGLTVYPLVRNPESFDEELWAFMARFSSVVRNGPAPLEEIAAYQPANTFFSAIAIPMLRAWVAGMKFGQADIALDLLEVARQAFPRNDWLLAGQQWMQRRQVKRALAVLASTP